MRLETVRGKDRRHWYLHVSFHLFIHPGPARSRPSPYPLFNLRGRAHLLCTPCARPWRTGLCMTACKEHAPIRLTSSRKATNRLLTFGCDWCTSVNLLLCQSFPPVPVVPSRPLRVKPRFVALLVKRSASNTSCRLIYSSVLRVARGFQLKPLHCNEVPKQYLFPICNS